MVNKSLRQQAAARNHLRVHYDEHDAKYAQQNGASQDNVPGNQTKPPGIDGCLYTEQTVKQDENAKRRKQLSSKSGMQDQLDDSKHHQQHPAGKVMLKGETVEIIGQITC